jgi:hypothetical protein
MQVARTGTLRSAIQLAIASIVDLVIHVLQDLVIRLAAQLLQDLVIQVARRGTVRSADTSGHCKHCRSSDTRVAGFSYTIGSATTAGSGDTNGQERYCKTC